MSEGDEVPKFEKGEQIPEIAEVWHREAKSLDRFLFDQPTI